MNAQDFIDEATPKKKANFIFGDIFGGAMAKMPLRAQYEGTMVGSALILICLVGMIFYWAFSSMEWYWKVIYIINGLSGLLLLWSSLVTTFQQYQSYMEIESVVNIINSPAQTIEEISDEMDDKKLEGGM